MRRWEKGKRTMEAGLHIGYDRRMRGEVKKKKKEEEEGKRGGWWYVSGGGGDSGSDGGREEDTFHKLN